MQFLFEERMVLFDIVCCWCEPHHRLCVVPSEQDTVCSFVTKNIVYAIETTVVFKNTFMITAYPVSTLLLLK